MGKRRGCGSGGDHFKPVQRWGERERGGGDRLVNGARPERPETSGRVQCGAAGQTVEGGHWVAGARGPASSGRGREERGA
jgi:hypothetical protein